MPQYDDCDACLAWVSEYRRLQAEVERLREALLPFSLYASAVADKDWDFEVASKGNQALCAAAFKHAKQALAGAEEGGDVQDTFSQATQEYDDVLRKLANNPTTNHPKGEEV